MKRSYIYTGIYDDNTYDYDNVFSTTDDIETAYNWIRLGLFKEVAMLDALSLEYLGSLDVTSLPEFKKMQDE